MQYRCRFKRVVRKFAIFPIVISGDYRWLETVYIVQRYDFNAVFLKWYNCEFTTKSEYEKDKQKWFITSGFSKEDSNV